MKELMPVIYFGHGNPLNAISSNSYTEGWRGIGGSMPRPKAVLAVSAHWYVPFCAVTVSAAPRTIHDFGGFPQELYQVSYPAAGSPELAERVRDLLSPTAVVELDKEWGLDHGTWVVLRHLFPDAEVPVVQLSIDERQPARFHFELGRLLAPLREEGVLVIGSGNLVHNLQAYAWGRDDLEPYAWGGRFEARVRELLDRAEDAPLVDYQSLGRDAILSVPTPDHYLPLLYILGLRRPEDQVSYPVTGVDGGSVSMLTVRFDR